MAERFADRQLLFELHLAAEQLDEYELAAKLLTSIGHVTGSKRENEWAGETLDEAALVIDFKETEKQGAATGLRFTGFAAAATKRAKKSVLITEDRLVPLYARTFPDIEVVPGPARIAADTGTPQYFANMRTLQHVLGSSAETIHSLFTPLKADAKLTAELRKKYQKQSGLPLVGICWWSSHHGKELPSLDCWADMMRQTPATFVNIQYGDVENDLAHLTTAAGKSVISDDTVDQLKDMDRFAAQLAALDAVVTISCTGAHLACALRAPTLIIRDDWFRRSWPVLSEVTPWCPSATVIGKNGQNWETVFNTVPGRLQTIFDNRPIERKTKHG